MKRYLEQLQDDVDSFKDAEEAAEWVKANGGYEYTPTSPPTFIDKIKMGMENLYPRWLFRNFGQFFIDEEFNKKADKWEQETYYQTANPNATNSELDAKKIVYPPYHIDRLENDGYVYNDILDWYERTWSTNEGKETIKEVYKEKEDGWYNIMIGYGDRVFYEEKIQ